VTSQILIPEFPALVVSAAGAAIASSDGELETLTLSEAQDQLKDSRVILCHSGFTARRAGIDRNWTFDRHFDVLELFVFVKPANFCLPTASGLARALGLPPPGSIEDEAATLQMAVSALLNELTTLEADANEAAAKIGFLLSRAGWPWGPCILAALDRQNTEGLRGGLDIWNQIKEWEEQAPQGDPGNEPIDQQEVQQRLTLLTGPAAELRPEQRTYAEEAIAAFEPRDDAVGSNVHLSEAGTGIGKTLGYIAPASLWAEKNGPNVWISTFTRNLQRQIDQEITRLFPDPSEKAAKTVVRKGRENYLCLLNFEESVSVSPDNGARLVGAGLVARWALASKDGDMVGGDFPAWLSLPGMAPISGLTDRRGECIYSACPHYKKCFVEKAIRKARRADLVVANHALVMTQAATDYALEGDKDEPYQTTFKRLIFDEGHHVFDAADSAFSSELSGYECAELRRWIRGPEGRGRRSRGRGLKERLEDLLPEETGDALTDEVMRAAAALPLNATPSDTASFVGQSPAESFFRIVREQIRTRNGDARHGYGMETDCRPPVEGLIEAAAQFNESLERIRRPLTGLTEALKNRLDDDADKLETHLRVRIESAIRSLARRSKLMITAWQGMLRSIKADPLEPFVDWFALDRIDGRDIDVAMRRHWIDPTIPFAAAVLEPAQGVLITSATLRDAEPDDDTIDWQAAEIRTGAAHLPTPARRSSLKSPFDYANQTRVFVINDLSRDDFDQVAAAYRELFLASKGGALGLFTAIARLRAVHSRITKPLGEAGLEVFGQHVDAIDTGTLVDIFRAETNSCLMGTDAVRDGVDVPGNSLRLIVFDRVPWPRPDILHKARRQQFGGRRYDDMITRLRLKQAYGRLIRRADDRGVFVMLDSRTPSRLATAFPDGVEINRAGLAETISEVGAFLNQ
jgi:ATP-dependent DNA helicase DinG